MSSTTIPSSKVVAFAGTLDGDRARAFYEGVLGLKLLFDDTFALVFDANGTTLRVSRVPKLEPHPFTVLGWEVADIRAAAAEMSENGVVFERYEGLPQDEAGIMTFPGGTGVAWFKDPDGNILSISQHA